MPRSATPARAAQEWRLLKSTTNVLAVGKPGVGKSHALAAVAHELVVQGHAVLWSSTASLVQRLLAAKRDLRLPQELARLEVRLCHSG